MAFVENATGGWEVLAISKRFRGGAVVSMMGGGVYDGNGSIEGRPCVSRLVMMIPFVPGVVFRTVVVGGY